MNRFLWPLICFALLVVLLAFGLSLNPRDVPSPLVGKPAPMFRLERLETPGESFSPQDMLGKVWLLNVWSTWCISCRQEHPVLVEFSRRGNGTPIVGLNYKELRGDGEIDMRRVVPEQEAPLARERAAGWLKQHGDPYLLTVMDIDGRVGIDYGVYGVPETYVIDKEGVIRMKHTGPVSPQILNDKILPLVAELSR